MTAARRKAQVALTLATGMLTACALQPYTPAALDTARLPLAVDTARLGDEAQHALLDALGAVDTWPPAPWTVGQLGLVAIQRSLAVGAAQAEVVAAQAAQVAAARGPNPTIGLGVARNSDLDPGDSSRWSVGPNIEYLWSPVDRSRILGALAATAVAGAQGAVLEAAWAAWRAATASALDLLAARERYALETAHAAALDVAVATARRQVAAGLAGNVEWQALELDANGIRIARIDSIARVSRSGTALAGALNLPVAALEQLSLIAVEPPPPPDYAQVQRQALLMHPAVLRGLAAYDHAERALELAVAEQYPQISLNPGYLFDQGDNVWSLLGGVVVPLLGYHKAGIASAAAKRDAARARFHTVQAKVIAALQAAWGEWTATAAALSSAQALRADLGARARDLLTASTKGLVEPLTVTRANVQLAALDLELGELEGRRRYAANELAYAARTPLFDEAMARYLAQLAAGQASQTDAGE